MLFMSARSTGAVRSTQLPTRHRNGRWLLAMLPVLALSILLTACGGSSSSTASPTTSPPTSAAGQASSSSSFTKYTQCLTSHGVPANAGLFGRRGPGSASGSGTTVPGASSAPTGTRPTIPAQYQKAVQACASLRPTGGFGGFGGFGNSATAAAYRNCLQIHGVKLPTSSTTTPGQAPSTGGAGGFGQLRNNPTFQAAQKACASLLPARPGSTSSTTTASGA